MFHNVCVLYMPSLDALILYVSLASESMCVEMYLAEFIAWTLFCFIIVIFFKVADYCDLQTKKNQGEKELDAIV